jgi:REP element-mobilizing transposase RayT
MARSIRIQHAGAVYHVMARGKHGQRLFQDHKDHALFLETLCESCQKTGWRIHAYILMGNHYHPLVEPPRMSKSAPEKMVLAWWLRQGTTVPLRWLNERLAKGHFTRVSQAISKVQRQPVRDHANTMRRLGKLAHGEEI